MSSSLNDGQGSTAPTLGMQTPSDLPTATISTATTATQDSSSSTETGDHVHDKTATGTFTQHAMETRFASREALLAYITEFCLAQGFAIVIHKSNVPRGQLWLRCDLGGAVRASGSVETAVPPPTKRKRKASDRQQNCPFRLYGRRLVDGAWVLKVQNDHHTHALASRKEELVAHPIARRLTNAQKRLVLEMTDTGIRPAVIVERLKAQFPDKPIKVQDIYNARNHIRIERRAGRVPFPEAGECDRVDAPGEGVSKRPRQSSNRTAPPHNIQGLVVSILDHVPQWSSEDQATFIHKVYGLLKNRAVVRSSDDYAEKDHQSIEEAEVQLQVGDAPELVDAPQTDQRDDRNEEQNDNDADVV